MIENGSSVSIEYTLKLDDGTVVDTNVGKDPLTYKQGAGQILPALMTNDSSPAHQPTRCPLAFREQ